MTLKSLASVGVPRTPIRHKGLTAALLITLSAGLVACGQKGPLVLPQDAKPAAHAPAASSAQH
ncbi:MAG: lipoprotein [Paucibacter sp.]|nr:lipoprotein [Roseateles sp.]MBV8379916.1 lipoprotein [Roseateles sp.]